MRCEQKYTIKITGNLGDVYEIDDTKVFDLFSDGEECLVHLHAMRVPIVAKTNDYNLVLFAQNCLKLKCFLYKFIYIK